MNDYIWKFAGRVPEYTALKFTYIKNRSMFDVELHFKRDLREHSVIIPLSRKMSEEEVMAELERGLDEILRVVYPFRPGDEALCILPDRVRSIRCRVIEADSSVLTVSPLIGVGLGIDRYKIPVGHARKKIQK